MSLSYHAWIHGNGDGRGTTVSRRRGGRAPACRCPEQSRQRVWNTRNKRSQHKIAVGFLKSVKFTGNMQYENTRKGADWAVAGCSTGLYVKNPRLLSHNAATGALMVAAKRWLLNLWARCRCVHRRSNRC